MANEKKIVDWAGIEREYRVGIRSLRSLGDQYGVSEGAIRKRANKDGWTKDLAAKVQARADELVRKEEVRKQVRTERESANRVLDESERNVVEVNAQVQATVMREHRETLQTVRGVLREMIAEVESLTFRPELIERLLDMIGEHCESEAEQKAQIKRIEAFTKAMNIHVRVDSLKKLVEASRTVVQTEREIFGMDNRDTGKENPYEDMTDEQIDQRIAYLVKKNGIKIDD
jgi:hypothetical protein